MALVKYLEVVKGGEHMDRKVWTSGPLHPSLQRAMDNVLTPSLYYILMEQQLLDNDNADRILKLIPEESTRKRVMNAWKDLDQERDTIEKYKLIKRKWQILHTSLQSSSLGSKPSRTSGRVGAADTGTLSRDMVFQITYPRLDSNVSIHINHLLKSPFCVHPKTGRVCVPIDPEDCEDFDPFQIPTVSQLVDELNSSMEIDSDIPGSLICIFA
jgi:DNA primase small subunit